MTRSIEFDFSAASRGIIKIDGEPVKGVRGATIHVRLNEPTTVQLELVGYEVSGNAPAAEDLFIETTECNSDTKQYVRT